jgi:predicted small secreted protein
MTKKISAAILAVLYLTGVTAVLAGCNTMEGVGKDVEAGGRDIKNEAKEHNNNN